MSDLEVRVHLGEVSEWLIEQPWKGCVGLVLTAGSNPALSVSLFSAKMQSISSCNSGIGMNREKLEVLIILCIMQVTILA